MAKTYKVKEVAEIYNISPPAITALIHTGVLDAVDVRAKGSRRATWRITEKALEEFERNRSKKHIPTPSRKRRRKVKDSGPYPVK